MYGYAHIDKIENDMPKTRPMQSDPH